MRHYLAPMEGITTYIYRRAYHRYFAPMDKYFTPFLVPHMKQDFNAREYNEILPEHNQGLYLVPQILTNDAEGFLRTEKRLREYGYREVNLNLGCPSRTVVAKKRGAGFLAFPAELDWFLHDIFMKAEADISVKTRIGRDSPEEFPGLLEIFNRYPIRELIIHPRIQTDFYKNSPHMPVFKEAVKESRNALCYNGDVCSVSDYQSLKEQFPELPAVMFGRGIIGNPGLLDEITGGAGGFGEAAGAVPAAEKIEKFHNEVLEGYLHLQMGDKNVLFKMKELWSYMGVLFPGGERILKRLKKSQHIRDYVRAAEELFALLSPGAAI